MIVKKIQRLVTGFLAVIAMLTGVALYSPLGSSPLSTQQAHACTGYYAIVWSEVGVRLSPGGTIYAHRYYGNYVFADTGGTQGGWTHIWYGSQIEGYVHGYIPEASRDYKGCL